MAQSAVQKLVATRAKIAALTALLPALELAAANDVDPARLVPGAVIEFTYGRKEKREVTATIKAVKQGTGEKGSSTQLKVEFGDDFDATLTVIFPAQVNKVVSSPVAATVAEGSDTPADDFAE